MVPLLHDAPHPSQVGDGAVIDRLVRMRTACQALTAELAVTRRELRAAESELRRLRERQSPERHLAR